MHSQHLIQSVAVLQETQYFTCEVLLGLIQNVFLPKGEEFYFFGECWVVLLKTAKIHPAA